jgi:uncharacterized membrane protein
MHHRTSRQARQDATLTRRSSHIAPLEVAGGEHRSTAWLLTTAIAGLAALLAAAAPLMPDLPRGWVMAMFDPFCHQLPERSFHMAGHAFALCHRCFGVIAGCAAGAAAAPWLGRLLGPGAGRGLPLLAMAALPMLVDVGLALAGLWTNTPASRFATGLVFGVVAGAVLVESLAVSRYERAEV